MALIESRHCGRPERHEQHRGREITHMGGHPVVCHGDPKRLADQQWAEANPPPGPPDIPRWYEWGWSIVMRDSCGCAQNTAGDICCHRCGEYVNVRCWNCWTPRGGGECPTLRC